MNVAALRYLVAVAEDGHFGRAAQRLHVSQPSISQAIARLERQFGAELLDRSAIPIRPTAAGERALVEIRASLAHLDRAVLAGRGPAAPAPLRVACTPFASMWLATQVLAPYREAHPGAEVGVAELDVPAQRRALLAGTVDVAVGESVADHPSLLVTTLREDPCAVWMGAQHPLAAHGALTLDMLAGVPLIVGHRDVYPTYGPWVVETLRAAGVEPALAPLTMDTPSAFSLMLEGSAVSLACDMLAPGAVPGLVIRRVLDPVHWRWVITHRRGDVTAVGFVAWAISAIAPWIGAPAG